MPAQHQEGSTDRVPQEAVRWPNPAEGSSAPVPAQSADSTTVGGNWGIGRRQFLAGGTAAAVLFGAGSTNAVLGGRSPGKAGAAPSPASAGQWTAPFNLTLVSIHAVLLHSGQVLLFSWPSNTVGSDAQLWDPVSSSLTNVSLTYQRDIFCAGTTAQADGQIFIAGGHLYQGVFGDGVANTTTFDPASNAWTEGPSMSQARWYPTTVELGDGTVMIFAGTTVKGTNATTVDHYNPSTGTLTTLQSTASKAMATYPRMQLTTSGLIAWTNLATTWFFNPATATWSKGPILNSKGRGVTDTSVLLPGLTQIMEIGGNTSTGTTNTCEILDLSSSNPSWQYTTPMNYGRVWANTVLLADGTVLVVGGGASGSYSNPIFIPELYNPVSATWTQMAAQTAPRMYHSTALLLPDGRVLSAGQSKGSYQTTGEIFSPPYLFAGSRPTISSAPTALSYNQQFTITTPNYASIQRVALVKAGSVTHSTNFDQRYVDLTYRSNGVSGLTATAPPDSNHAPPGWYMLFILSSGGVPSVASWVQVA